MPPPGQLRIAAEFAAQTGDIASVLRDQPSRAVLDVLEGNVDLGGNPHVSAPPLAGAKPAEKPARTRKARSKAS